MCVDESRLNAISLKKTPLTVALLTRENNVTKQISYVWCTVILPENITHIPLWRLTHT